MKSRKRSRKKLICVIGPNGVGKEGVAEALALRYSLQRLCTSDLLTSAAKANHPLASEIWRAKEAGQRVDDSIVVQVVGDAISEIRGVLGFSIDGFPRSIRQAKYLIDFCKKHSIELIVLFLDANDEVCFQRSLKRKREGETPELIRSRLEDFRETHPHIETVLQTASCVDTIQFHYYTHREPNEAPMTKGDVAGACEKIVSKHF